VKHDVLNMDDKSPLCKDGRPIKDIVLGETEVHAALFTDLQHQRTRRMFKRADREIR
jgi:hypothetical protein